jgi:hypothetical protein
MARNTNSKPQDLIDVLRYARDNQIDISCVIEDFKAFSRDKFDELIKSNIYYVYHLKETYEICDKYASDKCIELYIIDKNVKKE